MCVCVCDLDLQRWSSDRSARTPPQSSSRHRPCGTDRSGLGCNAAPDLRLFLVFAVLASDVSSGKTCQHWKHVMESRMTRPRDRHARAHTTAVKENSLGVQSSPRRLLFSSRVERGMQSCSLRGSGGGGGGWGSAEEAGTRELPKIKES